MTDLAGEVEDDLPVAHQIVHGALLPDVGDVDAHAVGDAVDVEQVAAVIGDQRVDQQTRLRRAATSCSREVAADEPETAGDHHATAVVKGAVIHAHGRGALG